MTTLKTEPKATALRVYDASGREWVKTEFLWNWTNPATGNTHNLQWEVLSELLGPIRDKK